MIRTLWTTLVVLGVLGLVACRPHLTPVAQIANVAGEIEDSADTIVLAASRARLTGVITVDQLAAIAIAGDKIGRVGKDLGRALASYNAARVAGTGDISMLSAAIQGEIKAVSDALRDIGQQVPPGVVQQIDQASVAILTLIAQVRAGLVP